MQDAGALAIKTERERLAIRAVMESSHIDFCRYFMRRAFNEQMVVSRHHRVIAEKIIEPILNATLDPPRAIINLPPGYTKTMEVVIMLVARGLARFRDARFIQTSFSDPLVQDNSTATRDIIQTPEFQALWPMAIRPDVARKGLWRTTDGGGMLAAASRGTITGFRAGRMERGRFTGALIIDDPLKPDHAWSASERKRVNERFNNTLRTRLAHEGVPIIVIMQRLHDDDLSGFLLRGGSGDYWHHLMLPAWIDNGLAYPSEYTHGIPVDHGLPDGPLWEWKHDAEQIEVLKRAPHVYHAQYAQRPQALGGTIFRREHFQYWREGTLPNLAYRVIYADTAQKDGEHNDFSCFACWGKGTDGRAYLLDLIRGKWLAPELLQTARAFWQKQAAADRLAMGSLRAMKVEDKVSGTTLIQTVPAQFGIPIEAIQRNRDKLVRAHDTTPAISSGLVVFPRDAAWLHEFENEVIGFPGAAHDDMLDTMMDAVEEMVGTGGSDLLDLLN